MVSSYKLTRFNLLWHIEWMSYSSYTYTYIYTHTNTHIHIHIEKATLACQIYGTKHTNNIEIKIETKT